MKKIKTLFVVAAILFMSAAVARTVMVTGPVESAEYKVKNFSILDVRSQFDVYMTQGDKEEVVIETYRSLMPYVRVEKEGKRLNIYLDKKLNNIRWSGKKHLLSAHVTVKDLEKITLSGACDLYMQSPLVTEDLKISASGASDLALQKISGKTIKIITSGASDIDDGDLEAHEVYINASGASDGDIKVVAKILDMIASGASDFDIDVDVDDIKVSAYGSSDFIAKGKSKVFKVNVSGSSDMQAFDLISDTVIVDASGSSTCNVNAKVVIDATSSGVSTIYFTGRPEKTKINVSGISTIKSK
jgi:hypothetical protein